MQGHLEEKQGVEKSRTERNFGGTAREWLRKAGVELCFGGVAYVLGHGALLFGTFPLGLAFLCAARGHTLSILLGLLISALFRLEQPVAYLCAYGAAAIIKGAVSLLPGKGEIGELPPRLREKLQGEAGTASAPAHRLWSGVRSFWLGARTLFDEGTSIRLSVAAICAFFVGVFGVIAGGFQYYHFFATLFLLTVTPLATLIYGCILSNRLQDAALKWLSAGTLLFSLIWAANSLTVFGIPFAVMLGFFCTLLACSAKGTVAGAVAGLVCGVAYHPLYAPAFLMGALTFSLLEKKGKEHTSALIAGFVVLFWSAYVGGAEAVLMMFPSCLAGGAAFTLAVKLRRDRRDREAPVAESLEPSVDSLRHRDSNERFRGISDAFSSLSEMFYNLSDRFRRPGTLDLRRICDDAFDTFCKDCPNKTVCWGLEYSDTLGTVNQLISRLHTRGRVTGAQISEGMRRRCDSIDSILSKINRDCATLTGEMLKNNRTEILAMDYESAANIINDALEEDDGEYRFDHDLEQKITEYLNDAGVQAKGVTVYGNRRRQIVIRGADFEQARVTSETLRSDLGEMCGLELSAPVFEVESMTNLLILRAKKKIGVMGAQINLAADGKVSGDSVNLFSNKKDYFYALISDGMGCGSEAALTSGICSVFLEKMLRAGNRAWTSLRMLNNMIRSREADSVRECSSTVDLLELDLMTAQGSFIKSGAAPSFVIRGGTVHRLQAGTVPIGIIRALDAQETSFPLKTGDTVVMISDGILQDDPECEWITSYLQEASSRSPEELVYEICRHAAESENHDDCSAVALRIQAAED